MDIVDMSEESRFEVAKKTLKEFVLSRSHDRVGLVVFSGEPLTLVPPTMDTGILLKSLADVEIGVLKDGTAIGDGLSVGVNRLKSVKAKSKVIVLLTDGDNNVGQIDPLVAGELAQGYGIKVYTIAIGKEGRVKVPIRRRGMSGNSVVTYQWQENALNTELLEKISKITQAKFYRVEDQNTLQKVFKEIDQLEPSLMPQKEKILYDEMFHRPLLWALWTLMLSLLFSFWRWGILL
jgi:Ca-activated chloride channel family protein